MKDTKLEERPYWENYIGKFLFVQKRQEKRILYFRGICKKVLNDKIILADIKNGDILLSFDGLSVTGVKWRDLNE
jgi:hypothetical protein